jgi:hypothetical protein
LSFIFLVVSFDAIFLKYFSSGNVTENFFIYSSSRITTDITKTMSIALISNDSIFHLVSIWIFCVYRVDEFSLIRAVIEYQIVLLIFVDINYGQHGAV